MEPQPEPLAGSASSRWTTSLGRAGWELHQSEGSAQDFHDQSHGPNPRPAVWVHRVRRTTAVLGSSQSPADLRLDTARLLGIEIAKRRSGGGLVVVEPRQSLWVDLILPRSHRWSQEDVGRSFDWLGPLWQRSLTGLDLGRVEVHPGPLIEAANGRVVCFAGLGSGEVTVDGHKVVGLSQRRDRYGARFQCLAVAHWPESTYRQILQTRPPGLDLSALNGGPSFDPLALLDRFVTELTAAEMESS